MSPVPVGGGGESFGLIPAALVDVKWSAMFEPEAVPLAVRVIVVKGEPLPLTTKSVSPVLKFPAYVLAVPVEGTTLTVLAVLVLRFAARLQVGVRGSARIMLSVSKQVELYWKVVALLQALAGFWLKIVAPTGHAGT
jgi:hypothetical protein